MSYDLRKHNARCRYKNWWRRYFWSQDEYWAKFAVSKAAHNAKAAKLQGNGTYYFWSQVSLRAAAFCERNYGPVPKILVHRPFSRRIFGLSSPEVVNWLRVSPPFRARKKTVLCST